MIDRTLIALQNGIAPVPRPFAELGARLGLSEKEALQRLLKAKEDGSVRRFGAVFDSAALGFRSTLCAVDLPEKSLRDFAPLWDGRPAITHVYVRDWKPSVWFTFSAREEAFASELKELATLFEPEKLLEAPALKKFKIRAVFGDDAAFGEAPRRKAKLGKLSELQKSIIKLFQGEMPLCEKPFAKAAEELGVAEETLLAQLESWMEDGALRRIGAVCRHRKLGFEGNAMCVWQAPPESLEEKASLLAKSPNVSHCCERKTSEAFPFNLYAMLHAPDAQGAGRLFEKLSAEAALPQGRMLRTKAELKKSSPVFY